MYHLLLSGVVCQMKFFYYLFKYILLLLAVRATFYICYERNEPWNNPDLLSFFLLLSDTHACVWRMDVFV